MFTLRGYQQKVIADTYNYIRRGVKRILLFAPTGAGKTIIATKIVCDAVSRNKNILFVVHRDILVRQTQSKFSNANLNCGFFKAGWSENTNAPVQIASVQTLPKRDNWKKLNFEVIIFDECHIVAFSKVCYQMMNIIFPNAIYIGLTATPWRLSRQESLGDIYSAIVCAPMPKELIESGFLVKPSYYSLDFNARLDEIEIVNGDYNPSSLGSVCNRPELIEQVCNSWHDLGFGRATIAFASGVSHAKNIAEGFNNRGINAAVVTGKTPISVREKLYRSLAEGKLKVLASCAALSEGFDVPQVSCVILSRPTKSKALYFQQLGRGLRLAKDKRDCIVLDQSRNVIEHGFVEDLAEVELFCHKTTNSKNQGQPPLKVCPNDNGGCGAYVYSFYMKCPHCQYNFDLQKLVTVLGSNLLISHEDEARLNFYRCKLREAYELKFAPSWAAMQFKNEYGFFPPYIWARGAIFAHQKSSINSYAIFLKSIAQRLGKKQDWIEKYLSLEFGSNERTRLESSFYEKN